MGKLAGLKMNKLLNIGFNNFVPVNRIICIVGYDAAPIKRIRRVANEELRLVDGTNGRKTRSVIVTDSNHIILSSAHPETLSGRIEGVF